MTEHSELEAKEIAEQPAYDFDPALDEDIAASHAHLASTESTMGHEMNLHSESDMWPVGYAQLEKKKKKDHPKAAKQPAKIAEKKKVSEPAAPKKLE